MFIFLSIVAICILIYLEPDITININHSYKKILQKPTPVDTDDNDDGYGDNVKMQDEPKLDDALSKIQDAINKVNGGVDNE